MSPLGLVILLPGVLAVARVELETLAPKQLVAALDVEDHIAVFWRE